jgi:hypothetical protein
LPETLHLTDQPRLCGLDDNDEIEQQSVAILHMPYGQKARILPVVNVNGAYYNQLTRGIFMQLA